MGVIKYGIGSVDGLSQRLSNILSNTDSDAIDSFSEVVAVLNQMQNQINNIEVGGVDSDLMLTISTNTSNISTLQDNIEAMGNSYVEFDDAFESAKL